MKKGLASGKNLSKRIWQGVKGSLALLASIPTRCSHGNTNYVSPWMKSCWDCGRVRRVDGGAVSVWHREAR